MATEKGESPKRAPQAAGAITVDSKAIQVQVTHEPPVARDLFHIGVIAECPLDTVYLAGIAFPKISERPERGADGQTHRARRVGKLEPLSPKQIEAIKEHAVNKVIRCEEGGRAQLHDRRSRRYQPHPGDVPAAWYTFARAIPEGADPAPFLVSAGPPMAAKS